MRTYTILTLPPPFTPFVGYDSGIQVKNMIRGQQLQVVKLGKLQKADWVKLLKPTGLIDGVSTAYLTITDTGSLVFVSQRYPVLNSPQQKYKTPVGYIEQERRLICVLILEGHLTSSDQDIGFHVGD